MVHDVKQKKRGTLKRKEIKNAKCQKLKKPQGILVLKPQQSGKNFCSSLKVAILLNVFRAPRDSGVVTF